MNEKQTTQLLESLASIAHSLENISNQLTPPPSMFDVGGRPHTFTSALTFHLSNIASDAQTDVSDLAMATQEIQYQLSGVNLNLVDLINQIKNK